jgi:hypothetical protein
VVAAAVAAGGAFGFDAFLARAPEVETARIARPTRIAFFILSSPFDEGVAALPALRDNPLWERKFPDGRPASGSETSLLVKISRRTGTSYQAIPWQ